MYFALAGCILVQEDSTDGSCEDLLTRPLPHSHCGSVKHPTFVPLAKLQGRVLYTFPVLNLALHMETDMPVPAGGSQVLELPL